MNILSQKFGGLRLVGRSSLWGFYIYGDVPTEDLIAAAQEGLRRLRSGQRQMALHPNCGTNLAVAGILAGLGAFLALGGLSKDQSESVWKRLLRLPFACMAAMLGIVIAQPLGPALQSLVTTQANVGNLRLLSVTREERVGVTIHHFRTGE